jgi:hypothetical protein
MSPLVRRVLITQSLIAYAGAYHPPAHQTVLFLFLFLFYDTIIERRDYG